MKTKTNQEAVAKVIGAAAWADGVFDDTEKTVCGEIAEALELDEAEFTALVEKTNSEISAFDEEKLNEYLLNAAAEIEEEDAEVVFECALEMVLADGVLQQDEVENLIAIADALGVDEARAILMLCDMIKDEPDMTVEL